MVDYSVKEKQQADDFYNEIKKKSLVISCQDNHSIIIWNLYQHVLQLQLIFY